MSVVDSAAPAGGLNLGPDIDQRKQRCYTMYSALRNATYEMGEQNGQPRFGINTDALTCNRHGMGVFCVSGRARARLEGQRANEYKELRGAVVCACFCVITI